MRSNAWEGPKGSCVCASDILYLELHGNNVHMYIVKNHWDVLIIYTFYINLLNINLEKKWKGKNNKESKRIQNETIRL